MPKTELDLAAYAQRIGLAQAAAPSLVFLRIVVAHHATAIPFENLDVILGRPIKLDIAAIQAKLVDAHRGGYCYEQNTLLRAALQEFGFNVSTMMARVVRGSPADAITAKTHLTLRVELPEGTYLADVGFGNLTPTAPLMLNQHNAQATDHEAYRFQPLDRETLLQVRLGAKWENVYRFTGQPSFPIDHEVGNWFTSTHPRSPFTANVVVARAGNQSRTTLFNERLTIRRTDGGSQRSFVTSETTLHEALNERFGINLPADDVPRLHAALRSFAERPERASGFD
jgi:N-hydroxyarylamine O-acetyltransferase